MTRTTGRGYVGDHVRSNVARLRAASNLSLRRLAARTDGTDHPLGYISISQIEKGARRVDVDDLYTLAEAFGVTPADLLPPAPPPVTRADVERLRDQLTEWLTAGDDQA